MMQGRRPGSVSLLEPPSFLEPSRLPAVRPLTFQEQLQLRVLDVAKAGTSQPKASKRSRHGERKRRRQRSSSNSSSTDDEGRLLKETTGLRSVAEEKPGMLLESCLKQMRRYLADRRGPAGSGREGTVLDHGGTAVAYLTTALEPSMRHELGLRSARELRTLAEVMGALAAGNVLGAGDLVAQRFRAVEKAATDGHWSAAKHLELIPDSAVTSVPENMLDAAMKREMFKLKLKEREMRFQGQH